MQQEWYAGETNWNRDGPCLNLSQDNLVASLQRTTCIYVGTASRLPLVSASLKNSFKEESSVQNSALLQCRLPDIGTKALPRLPFESFTDQLLRDRHVGSKWFSFGHSRAYACASALFLLVSIVHVLCYPVNVSYLLHYCLYLSRELLSRRRCAQC